MAKSSKNPRVLTTFAAPMKVEIRQPEFEPLASLAALDLKKLSKGNHKIEIGFITGGCCRNLVRAIIKDGMVTGCQVEPCKDSGKTTPPELLSLLATAHKKITAGTKWHPIPVSQFAKSSEKLADIITIGGGCILICVWGHCVLCCRQPRDHCFIPVIYTGPL